ncbi:hypothetical protein J2X69_003669 [Algoriphagus sp. 4150]|nr:hypothetical protein [Algoriphagus sp. 4150]
MKSSMTQASHNLSRTCFGRGVITPYARFHMATEKTNYNHMKSSMTQKSHTGMIISHARFHVTAKNQIINT